MSLSEKMCRHFIDITVRDDILSARGLASALLASFNMVNHNFNFIGSSPMPPDMVRFYEDGSIENHQAPSAKEKEMKAYVIVPEVAVIIRALLQPEGSLAKRHRHC